MNVEIDNKLKKIFFAAQQKKDMPVCMFICLYFLSFTLNGVINFVLDDEFLNPIVNAFFFAVLFIGIVATIFPVLKRSFRFLLCIEGFWIIVFLISFIMDNAENATLFELFVWTNLVCIPIATYIYSIKDKRVLYKLLLNTSYILSLSLLILFLLSAEDSDYSMFFSYGLLIPTLFHTNEWFVSRKKRLLVLFLVEIWLIFQFGSRGALLCIGVFLVLRVLLADTVVIKKLIVIFCTAAAALVFFLFYEAIGEIVLTALANRNITSRTLEMLFGARGEITIAHLGGRDDLYVYYFNLANQRPITGFGVAGGWISRGAFPHNIVLEMILSFGYIIGIAMFALIIMLFVKGLTAKGIYRDLILIFFSASIPALMFSGTFLMNHNLWIFVALAMSMRGGTKLRRLRNETSTS